MAYTVKETVYAGYYLDFLGEFQQTEEKRNSEGDKSPQSHPWLSSKQALTPPNIVDEGASVSLGQLW